MPNPNQAPQPEIPAQPAPGEFDHLLDRGPEQHLTVEDAAVRPPVDPGATSGARAEVERGAKLGELNAMYGPVEEQRPR